MLLHKIFGAADLTFTLYSDGSAYSITDCKESASGSISIPSEYNGIPVTSISANAFNGCDYLTSITIPNSVINIGSGAFAHCYSLTSVTIGDSVANIGYGVFANCSNLNSIKVNDNNRHYMTVDGILFNTDRTELIKYPAGKQDVKYALPNSVTSIGEYAFQYCTSLSYITIPDSVTNIGDYAFYFCPKFTSIAIPDSIINIGSYAFSNCNRLASVIIPDSVSRMGEGAFAECSGLIWIRIGNGITSISDYALYRCSNLASITIPDSVTSIGDYSFFNCYSLTSIRIGGSVTSIGKNAFAWCYSLATITIPDSVLNISDYAFYGCEDIEKVVYVGLEKNWKKINIGIGNDKIFNNVIYIPATPVTKTTNEINGVNLTWNAVEGAVKYNVYRRQGGQSAWTLVGTTTGTTLLDKNVKSGIYYCYSVRAYNSAGQYSDYVSTNTNTRKYMAVPKLTGISNATNGLYIKWNAVPGVTNGYRVYRRGAGSTYWTYLGTVKTTYYTDSEVKTRSGEYYRYTVIADGGYHSKFDTNGLYLKRLANPTLKSAVSSKAGITVKWNAVTGTTGYYVYRKTANSGWTRIATVSGTNNTTYLDKTAKKGVTYVYTVRAVYGTTTSWFNSGISCKDKY